MCIRPQKALSLEMFADADFAGLWNAELPDDPTSVRSRTGFVITLGGVPLVWGSRLQTEIALSTMEAEYIALSTSLRELLPLQDLLAELTETFQLETTDTTRVVRVFEDNNGALILANNPMPKMTPRSKHIGVKYHWFRTKLTERKIEILPIDTKLQKADGFTKGLSKDEFQAKWKLLMGW